MSSIPTDLMEWWLEISPEQIARSWQQTQATPTSQRRSFLNRLCVETFLPWFCQDYAPEAQLWSKPAATIWELFNGTAIVFNNLQVVLLPTEALDGAELEIPQEWVDLPPWAADYYLAVQIHVEEQWLRVWGYAAHGQVKQQAFYDACDLAYYIPHEILSQDLNAFWVGCQRYPQYAARDTLAVGPQMSAAIANSLIQQLQDCPFPRLRLPFDQWAALINHDPWREHLYQARLSAAQPDSSLVRLGQWFQNWFDAEWQSLSTLLNAEPQLLTPSLRAAANDATPQRLKWINLRTAPPLSDSSKVLLLLTLTAMDDSQVGVSIQLHPEPGQQYVPQGVYLTLLSDEDNVMVCARDLDHFIQLPRFTCPPGTRFSLQIAFNNQQITEQFMV